MAKRPWFEYDQDPYKGLLKAVLVNAIHEAQSTDPLMKCDAVGWMIDDYSSAPDFCEWLDYDYNRLRQWASKIDLCDATNGKKRRRRSAKVSD